MERIIDITSLYEHIDKHIVVKGNIKVTEAGAVVATQGGNKQKKEGILKVCAPFTNYIRRINLTQVENARKGDVVMLIYIYIYIYIYIKNSENYSKNSIMPMKTMQI